MSGFCPVKLKKMSLKKNSKKNSKKTCNSKFYISFVAYIAEQLKRIFMFGFLKIGKLFSKAAFRKSNRILEQTSAQTIAASQHIYGFVPTTHSQIQV
tara:strand:- start:20534 stop:20824 length:291 start_codon:yes stop_codon:yes gene_type:complete